MARGTQDQTKFRSTKLEGLHVGTLDTTLVIEDVAAGTHMAIRTCGRYSLVCLNNVVWSQWTKPGDAMYDYLQRLRSGRLAEAA